MVAISFFILLLISVAVYVLYAILIIMVVRRPLRLPAQLERYPLVSILKPIKSIDDGMEDNLKSFFVLNYPNYEILFGLDNCTEECVQLVESVVAQYPAIPVRIIKKDTMKWLNPKIEVLEHLEPEAAGELYWVTDSNVRV